MTLTATIKDGQMTADLSKIEVYLSGPDADPLIVCARFESTSSETGINTVATSGKLSRVYDISGRELPALKKGLNIVKTEDGKPTKLQEATIRNIRASGGTAAVVRSVEEVRWILAHANRHEIKMEDTK